MKTFHTVLRQLILRMVRFVPASLVLTYAISFVLQAHAQTDLRILSDQYRSATENWDAGQYVEALATFEALLGSEGGDTYFEDIALITGELFQTMEVAEWGTNPQWASDGPFFTYERPGEGGSVTVIVSFESKTPRELATIEGRNAQLIAFGTAVAYLKVDRGPEFSERRQAAFDEITERTREQFQEYGRKVRALEAEYSTVIIRDIGSGEERVVATPGLAVFEIHFHPAGEKMYLVASEEDNMGSRDIYELTATSLPRAITSGPGIKENLKILADEKHAIFTVDRERIAVFEFETGQTQVFFGSDPVYSADGATAAFFHSEDSKNMIKVFRLGDPPQVIYETEHPVENLAVSPNGERVVFQIMPRENWELMLVTSGSEEPRLLTHEIQHDLFPRFLDNERVFAVIGEGRHRRSYIHDLVSGSRTRVFHNNTVRTVAPEYEWALDRTGRRVLIVSERDGDTISPERGLYLVELDRQISESTLHARLAENRAAEDQLRRNGQILFEPIRGRVASVVDRVSSTWIYGYEKDLFAFGSKHISRPGNEKAIDYIADQLRSFGYEPELQWFEPLPGIRSANIIATLSGTVDPDVIYIVSSHFDSVERGPGADDNTSGTAALLDAARVLSGNPQPSTIKFAFFTGEEAGLLGSREYVRQAVERGDQLVGALNNDMVGFANDNRLDNTIQYSSDGIRDIQHAAAFLFTDLITYDARYYKNTDAHAYYEAYGDIVGGIGSYPILGNPHYHQSHDVLETINHTLVAEVSKTTVATIMLLASSPSRVTDLSATGGGDDFKVTWTPSIESNVTKYIVLVRTPDLDDEIVETMNSQITLTGIRLGAVISVRAVNDKGLPGWDRAEIVRE